MRFQRSGLFFNLLSHASAGGQLLHPSEVKSSMSVVCVWPLSNVVTRVSDAGCLPNKLQMPGQIIVATRTQTNFMIDLTYTNVVWHAHDRQFSHRRKIDISRVRTML